MTETEIVNNPCMKYLEQKQIRYIGFVPLGYDHAYMYYYMYGPDNEIKLEYENGSIHELNGSYIMLNKSLMFIYEDLLKNKHSTTDTIKYMNEFFNWLVEHTIPSYDLIFEKILTIMKNENISANNKIRDLNKIFREIGLIE